MTQTIAIAAIAVLAIITTIVTVFLASTIRKCFELSARLDDSETACLSANEKCVEVSAQLHALNDINSEQKKRINALNDNINELHQQHAADKAELSRLSELLRQAREGQNALTTRQEQLRKQSEETFRNIANDILKQNSSDFKQANETRLLEILKPVKDHFESINSSIRKYYEDGLKETASLKVKISELQELNTRLGKEANELAIALRGNTNNSQGPWGEMILKQILEGSGLLEGTNFRLQATTNADGSKIENGYRPDALIFFPDNKVLVIDSKVSITAYTGYANATTDTERDKFLKEHLRSVESHIAELNAKAYQKHVKNSADFVIMFMPNEGAYLAAMHGDPDLWSKAYNRQVILVSPTHLISVVGLISQLWTTDKQNRNAIRIAEDTGKLLDKLSDFIKDLEDVGKNLASAQKCYDNALNKFSNGRGNILKRANDIKSLGVKTAKTLPAYEDDDALIGDGK
ncbi:MAG: DNA recombination protein RmuC [Muribaculaceae bacterium]